MTAHVHGSTSQGDAATDAARPGRGPATLTRPWWLLPGVVGALLVAGLVVAGIVSLSTVLYLGLFGGMMLMCMGGHGHSGQGHGAHGTGQDGDESLSQRSSGAQPSGSGSAAGLDRRASHDPTTSETERHDQHSSHGCH
jgi:hypothetical protein